VPRNWDEHYGQTEKLDFAPVPLLVELAEQLTPGRALDLACGVGRNALYLAGLGWRVVAVDGSRTAIRILRDRSARIGVAVESHIANLENDGFAIEPDGYDLICDFFYLQRDLFGRIREGVRPGGVFTAEIHLRQNVAQEFVVEPGELRAEFSGWKILYYSEGARMGHGRPTARLIARRA
jgi:SAM-dependent methyltransferase